MKQSHFSLCLNIHRLYPEMRISYFVNQQYSTLMKERKWIFGHAERWKCDAMLYVRFTKKHSVLMQMDNVPISLPFVIHETVRYLKQQDYVGHLRKVFLEG